MRGRPHRDNAFSLVELLACLVIAGGALALLLPALTISRHMSRRTVCTSNARQITLGMISFATDRADGAYTDRDVIGDDSLVYLYDGRYLSSPDILVCPSTENRVRVSNSGSGTDSPRLKDLEASAHHAHDASGGHSYETFHHLNKGKFQHFTLDRSRLMRTSDDTVPPAEAFIVIDSDNDPGQGGWNDGYFGYNNIPDRTHNNHGDAGMNIAFLDGSARFVSAKDWIGVSLRAGHLDADSTDMVRAQRLLEPRLQWNPRADGGPGLHYWLE